jgi:hypothetical protein
MLQPYIHYQFTSPVWRLEIDPISEMIFAEIRDAADKKVHFAGISLINGKVFFNGLQTEERWLTGIETAFDGILLLHNYQSETGPEHRGMIAADGKTGEIIWSNYIYTFDHLSSDGPVVYDSRIQPRKLFLTNIKTGHLVRTYDALLDKALDTKSIIPDIVSSDIAKWNTFIAEPYGNVVHYLEYNNFRIVSLHTFADGALKQLLYVLDEEQIVYEDLLNTNIQKLQPESFLMHKDHLIYLKNKSVLKVLNL